jgi:Flp pilus assembly protein TadG
MNAKPIMNSSAEGHKFSLARRKPRERGIAIIVSAILLMFTVGIVGLAIDGGVAYFVKGRLMAAVDSAALGAGRGLNLGDTLAEAQTEATASATRFFKANFPDNFMGTDPAKTTIVPDFQMIMSNGAPTGVLQVTVTGEVTAPTYFMKIFSKDNMKIGASGTATRRTLVMMLILDISGSMGSRAAVGTIPATVTSTTNSCDAMIYSASKFLNYFSPYDYVGVATFGSNGRVNYAPSTNFKNGGASGANEVLRNLNCGGWTNTAPAINLSWDAIRNVGLKLAMNEMLLFTDGMPNQVTGTFPLRTQRDTRYGFGPAYSLSNPPTNGNLLYRDLREPSTACRNASMVIAACPPLPTPYSSAQETARTTHGVATPLYGDSRFLPLTAAQYSWYTNNSNIASARRDSFGWFLPSATGPYRLRWTQDNLAPSENFDFCRNTNTNVNTANRGVTWMCYMLPLPSTNTSPGSAYGTVSQDQGYHARFGRKANVLAAPVFGQSVGSFPSGFPGSGNGTAMHAQTIAYLPDTDAMGNSNRGIRDNWVYNVNQGCAPAGTKLPNGSTDLCKMRGGLWSSYPAAGLGTNFYKNNGPGGAISSGPYENRLRNDVPNTFPVAAMNSAISAAERVKDDTDYNIRIDAIYLIGNEDTVDREFLQVIANTKNINPTVFDGIGASPYTNTNYNQYHQNGLWYSTTDPQALASLFAQIASSLLRISR